MQIYEALRLLAMEAIVHPDEEALLRRVRRWYSKALSTPLAEVEKLDPFLILREYWEDHYEEMDEEARALELEELLETPEQVLERDRQFQRDEVDSIRIRRKIEANEQLAAAAKAAGIPGAGTQTVMKFMKPADTKKDTSLSKLPEVKTEENVKIQFVSAEDFEAELRGDALGQSK